MHRSSLGRKEVRVNLDDVVGAYEGDQPLEMFSDGRESSFVCPTIPALFLALRTPMPGLLGCDRAHPTIVVTDPSEIARVKASPGRRERKPATPGREAVPPVAREGTKGGGQKDPTFVGRRPGTFSSSPVPGSPRNDPGHVSSFSEGRPECDESAWRRR